MLDVAQRTRTATSASWCWVNLVVGDQVETVVGDGPGHDRLTGRRHPIEGTLTARVASSGHDVLVIDDTFDSATDWQMRSRVIRAGLGPCVMAVFRDEAGRLLGSLSVGRRAGDRPFDDDDAEIVGKAAAEVSALLNAHG
jgi:hypothetical protein